MFEDFDDESHRTSTALTDAGRDLALRKPVCPYICATPVNFEDELDFLAEKIYPRLVEFSLQRGAYFSPVDIRWKPGDGVIQNGQLLRFLLDYIHKCVPFFICLLGECYGPYRADDAPPLARHAFSIPESSPPLDRNYLVAASAGYEWVLEESRQHCSLTELQIIQAAFLGDGEHCNFYFRQAEHVEHKFADMSQSEKDVASLKYTEVSDEARFKIWDLKQRIVKKGLPVKYFNTLEDLGNIVYDDWAAVVDMLYPPLENLEHFIDTEDYTEWMSQESFAENLRQQFISTVTTDAVMEHMTEFALGVLDDTHSESDGVMFPKYRSYSASTALRKRPEETSKRKGMLIISGERGSGKSAVVAKWLTVFHEDNPEVKVIHHFVGSSAHSADIAVFLQRSIKQLQMHFLTQDTWASSNNLTSSWSTNEDQPTNFRESCEAFLAAASLGPCVLVLDGIDELGSSLSLTPQEVKEFLWLPATLPSQCRIIVTTTNSDLTFRSLSKRSDTQLISIPAISSASHKMDFLQAYMKQHYSHISKSCLQQILDIRLSSRPLFLSVLSSEMQCFNVYMKLEEFIEDNMEVCSVREFWTKSLQRWTLDYGWQHDSESSDDDEQTDFEYYGWVCDALCLLALSRNGLSQLEVMQLLRNMGYTDSLEVTQYDWLQFRSCLGPAVYDKADGLIDFSHQHLKEVVEYVILHVVKSSTSEISGGFPSDSSWAERKRKLHCHLVDYFSEQTYSQRRLQELPWQLMMAGDHDALLGFVTHVDYMLDMLDEKGKFPGNRHDLMTYWNFLSQHAAVDVSSTYHQVLVRVGLLESGLKNLQPVLLTEVLEDDDLGDLESVQMCSSRVVTSPHPTVPHHPEQLSVIEEGRSETEEKTSQQSCVVQREEKIYALDRGLVTSLGWHIGQFLLQLGHADSTEKIITGLVRYLSKHYPLSCREFQMMAECHEMLGNICHFAGNIRPSEGHYRRALRITVDLLGGNSGDLDQTKLLVLKSRLLGHHGSIRLSEGELLEAEDLLKESLESIQDCLGHVTLRATILYHLGILRFKQNDYLRAESCLKQCLSIREQWFGTSHALVADVLVALARLFSSPLNIVRCDKNQAEHLYSRAIQIRELCLPGNHLLTAEVLHELGCLIGEQCSQSAKMESIKLLRRALDTRTTRLGGNHPDAKTTQQCLTSQEVMLRLGHYEFGPAKPTEKRTPSNPYSSLSFREKDLNVLQKKRSNTAKNRFRTNQDAITMVSRENLLKHNRPLSIMGSSASMMTASERLLQESERPKLLRRDSMERHFQQSLELGNNVSLSDSRNSSLTSDSSIRRLTVDLSFAGSTAGGEDASRDPSALVPADSQIDSYATEVAVLQPQKSVKKSPVKARIDTRPVSAPLRLFARYGSAASIRMKLPSRVNSASCSQEGQPYSICSGQSHRSHCNIPGPHAIHISNSRSITGPHSSIYSLLDKPEIPRDMKRVEHHKSAWYHVKGRYSTSDAPVPPKRSQSRLNTIVHTSKPATEIRRKRIGKYDCVASPRSQTTPRSVHTSQSNSLVLHPHVTQIQREATGDSMAFSNSMVSFRPETIIVG